MDSIRYVHTNLIAKDWRKLAQFYIDVFACQPLYPERDLSGSWLEQATGIDGVHIRGIHLRLPGYENGPTLEIFTYAPENLRPEPPRINDQGFGHLAFHVDSVEELTAKLLAHGGATLGPIIRQDYPELGQLTFVYATDPEGNFIEIQNWQKQKAG
ncbi:catechol 2,3-dioxygenase-like lactoylglutathione lyase family enzyme [Hydrogenispora ethanolica]|jgi:predicted enzyme related to lactoylglutathione lyase|uniref:Catechol 2,3-dioxygenase-like lactoylglutathione lyase family enzyme n=1 Tax=Hydrogenispora ethanolica TaxID=1082276 RepID=A0A4R1RY84_HYDET|nr:VOC family protein [Hydrogenispora ethanolica]TCL70942.1 catechol 2,3-dioxygenase-like lactoylglutathione lyase family enzyme [Hydrogenispora ethanolica]